MAYNIKLFVHGVPNGQDIWGNPGADAKYVEAFYGRKSNVLSQMILEVMQFAGETNAYYTYFYYNDKIQDASSRTGGYFALTLRINYYYADIPNIYNLLEAAFNKFIIGSVLEYTAGGGCRFLISQLNQANDILKALEKELQHYLMQFSSDKDFISLNGFKSNGQNDSTAINLLEATPNVVTTQVRSMGKISVSSFYPSSKEQQIINKMNAEIQTVTANAGQQISAVRQKAQQDVLSAQKDKEQGILAVKNEYKEADKRISQLSAQKDKAEKEINRLNAQVNDLNAKLQKAQSYKEHYEEYQKKVEKMENLIAEIKNNLSGLSGISELLGISSVATRGYGENEKSYGLMSFIKKIHPLTAFAVMVVLLGIIGVTLLKSCDSKDNSIAKKVLVEQTQQLQEEDDEKGTNSGVAEEEDGNGAGVEGIQETLQSLKGKYPTARIDVSDIYESKGQFMQVGSKTNYVLSIQGVPEELKGEWVCDSKDFDIQDNKIIPKRAGRCTITYKVNGVEFLTKEITVKQ